MANTIQVEVFFDVETGELSTKLDNLKGAAGKKGSEAGDAYGNNFKKEAKQGLTGLDLFVSSLLANIATSALRAITGAVRDSISRLASFERGISEINSIIGENSQLTEEATNSLIGFSSQFATGAAQQAKAFYSIVSAGIKGVNNQLGLLKIANQAAVAGLVDIDTSAFALVSSVNAFRSASLTAKQASDALFAAVREGQTTFGELAQEMGTVNPLAAQAGLAFNELTGAIAFLTKGGARTNTVVTQLRQFLVSIIKPTKEASDEAKRLGIQFNTASLRTKGFAGFLSELREKTGGSEASIAKLFGNVRALTGVLPLLNGNVEDLNRILDATKNSAGDTAGALAIISQGFDFRLRKTRQQISNFFLEVSRSFTKAFQTDLNTTLDALPVFLENLVIVGKGIRVALIAPLELLFNTARVVFRGMTFAAATMFAGIVNIATKVLSPIGSLLEKALGIDFKAFAETSAQVAKDSFDSLDDSVDKIFEGSVFDKSGIFLDNLQANLQSAKVIIDESGVGESLNLKPQIDVSAEIEDQTTSLSTFFSELSAAFGSSTRELKKNLKGLSKASIKVGQDLKKGIGQGAGAGFAAFGKALAEGENGFDAFAKSFLSTLGQMMVQQGTAFILQGIGFNVIPGLQASGSTLIATGAALATFGGVLGAIGGSAPSPSGGTGGGFAESLDTFAEAPTDEEDIEERSPTTVINLTVQGDILDSDQTGLRIIELINNELDNGQTTINRRFA